MELPADVCASGHALAPGSDPITLTTIHPDGKATKETKLLRRHHVRVPGAYGADPEDTRNVAEKDKRQIPIEPARTMDELSPFDPTGLVAAICGHGLPQHPDPRIQSKAYGAGSWIRSKYVGFAGTSRQVVCPVCLGEPRPDDLTTPANGE